MSPGVHSGENRRIRFDLGGFGKKPPTLLKIFSVLPEHTRQSAVIEIAGFGALDRPPRDAGVLAVDELDIESRHNLLGNLILKSKQVIQFAAEAIGPDRLAGLGVDQLGGNPYLVAGLAHGSYENMAYSQLPAYLLRTDLLVGVELGRGVRNEEETRDFDQIRIDIGPQSCRKVVLLRIATQIDKRERR